MNFGCYNGRLLSTAAFAAPLLKRYSKIFLIMRLIILLIVVACLQSSATVYSQGITIKANNEPFKQVMQNISRQSGYSVFTDARILDKAINVTLNVEKAGLDEVLTKVFAHQPLAYSIVNKTIVIRESGRITLYPVKGVVLNENGEPIAGASVFVKGRQGGTTTTNLGEFSLDVQSASDSIVITHVGYVTQVVSASVSGQLIVVLRPDVERQGLDEIVIIGYGTVNRKDLTGAVSSPRMDDINEVPVVRVDQMLQGRIAGAEIVSTTGEPGANTSIRIRGTRSISANNEPLFVVDGVMDAITDLNDISPADILSIDVLKDVSSTAIYGSRGSNGVIIITTKSGRESGKTNFTLRSELGYAELPRFLDLMNASEFAQLQNDWFYISNINNETRPIEDYYFPDPLSFGEGTNWTDVITRRAPYTNLLLSGSGGTKTSKYYFSGNYNNTQGIIMNSGLQRYQTRLNLDKSLGKRVNVGFKLNYSYINQELNTADVGDVNYWYRHTLFLNPMIAPYKEDGSFEDWNNLQYEGTIFDSPLAMAELMKRNLQRKTLNLIGYIEVEPVNNLKIRSHVSFYDYNRFSDYYYPGSLPTRANRGSGGYAYKAALKNNNILNENTITYKKTWNKLHNFEGLYGFTYQQFWNNNMTVSGEGYFIDEMETHNMGAIPSKETISLSSYLQEQVKVSNFARFNYNFNRKYYITTTLRADASSNFSADNKWGYFPSAAFRWSVINEEFMKGQSTVSDLAFRISAGVAGNDAIPIYQSLSAMETSTSGYIFGGAIPVSYFPSRIENNRLTWEKTSSLNFGIDFGFLKNRIRGSFEYYTAVTKDLLLTLQYPTHTGYPSRLANIGGTKNNGIEMTLETKNIVRPNFSWSSTVTVARNKQVVTDIGGFERVQAYTTTHASFYPMYAYQQGYPLNALWGMVYAGTWKSQAEINANETTKQYASASTAYYSPGRQRYIDQNQDGVLDYDDMVYLGNADPDVYGGLQNNFDIYGLNISFFFNYSVGGRMYNPAELFMGTGSRFTNQYKYMVNAWHPVRNPNSDYPRANSKDQIPNDRFVHDASFVRLKNVSLSYQFDLQKLTAGKLNTLTLFGSGNNLFLWKKYNGFDPEVSSVAEGATIRRMDNGAYPASRTVIFGAQLNF